MYLHPRELARIRILGTRHGAIGGLTLQSLAARGEHAIADDIGVGVKVGAHDGPETARSYLDQCGNLWRMPCAVAFVRWLHKHPKVLAERASVLECQEALLWEHDFEKRQALGLKEEAARARIDDVLSAEIVRKKADRHGRPIDPWRYQRTRF